MAKLLKGMTDEQILRTVADAIRAGEPVSVRLYRAAKKLGLQSGFWAGLGYSSKC